MQKTSFRNHQVKRFSSQRSTRRKPENQPTRVILFNKPYDVLPQFTDEAVKAFRQLEVDKVVVKAQVLTGGRGKAGGIKLADNEELVRQHAREILKMTIKGFPVTRILISEAVDIAAEYYVSFTIDRNTRSVVLIMSTAERNGS